MATLYLVRHAKAGDRDGWEGDDHLRPLSKSGWRQADALVDLFKRLPVDRILSSPYLRCVQTVEPLSRQRGLRVETNEGLAEGAGSRAVFDLIRGDQDVVVCTHGDIVQELLEGLAADSIVRPRDAAQMAKGSIWVIEHAGGRVQSARYMDAP